MFCGDEKAPAIHFRMEKVLKVEIEKKDKLPVRR
jgi:hypothetical protein